VIAVNEGLLDLMSSLSIKAPLLFHVFFHLNPVLRKINFSLVLPPLTFMVSLVLEVVSTQ
jgi:cytochrome c oxidase subunit IV